MVSTTGTKSEAKRYAFWAATLSVVAGLVHMTVVSEHLSEWWGYGVFFIMAGLAQILYGLVLFFQPWRYDDTGGIRTDGGESVAGIYYWTGIVGNSLIILLYLITRTVGIPLFGPDAGQVEPVTAISLVSKALEIAVITCLSLALRHRQSAVA